MNCTAEGGWRWNIKLFRATLLLRQRNLLSTVSPSPSFSPSKLHYNKFFYDEVTASYTFSNGRKDIEILLFERSIFSPHKDVFSRIKNSTNSRQTSKTFETINDTRAIDPRNQRGSRHCPKKPTLRKCDFRERFERWLDAIGIGQNAVASGSSLSFRFPVQLVDALVIGISSPCHVFARPDPEILFNAFLTRHALR